MQTQRIMQDVVHVDIPYDELGIFKVSSQDTYQHILTQTLLLSTIATLHTNTKQSKCSLFITVKSLWLLKKQKIKTILPLKSILAVVKSDKHPQIVLITRENLDNLRISTSCQDRCWSVISALSYVFTYVVGGGIGGKGKGEGEGDGKEGGGKGGLGFVVVGNGVLDYFQRTAGDKKKNRDVNIDSYPKQYLIYKKPFKNSPDVFNHLSPTSKIILQKQLQFLCPNPTQTHQIYLARIRDHQQQSKIQLKNKNNHNHSHSHSHSHSHKNKDKDKQKDNQSEIQEYQYEQQDRYICHYVEKKQEYLEMIYQHRNLEYVVELVYGRVTDFKIQMFFQYSQSLRGHKILPIIFKKIWQLHSTLNSQKNPPVLTTDTIQFVQRSNQPGKKVKRNQFYQTADDELNRWIRGNRILVVNQFRYQFLNQVVEWDRFIFQDWEIDVDVEEEGNGEGNRKFLGKCYNIGLILYELSTGRNLFSYIPAFINEEQVLEEQLKLITEFKRLLRKENFEIFPKFMDLGLDESLKDFIKSLIYRRFKSQNQIWAHSWYSKKPEQKQHNSQIFQQ